MPARRKVKGRARDGRLIVRKPSKLKDYMRLYGIKNGVLEKAKQLEKALCIPH